MACVWCRPQSMFTARTYSLHQRGAVRRQGRVGDVTNFRPALRVDDELRHHFELDVLGVTASVGVVVSQLQ